MNCTFWQIRSAKTIRSTEVWKEGDIVIWVNVPHHILEEWGSASRHQENDTGVKVQTLNSVCVLRIKGGLQINSTSRLTGAVCSNCHWMTMMLSVMLITFYSKFAAWILAGDFLTNMLQRENPLPLKGTFKLSVHLCIQTAYPFKCRGVLQQIWKVGYTLGRSPICLIAKRETQIETNNHSDSHPHLWAV